MSGRYGFRAKIEAPIEDETKRVSSARDAGAEAKPDAVTIAPSAEDVSPANEFNLALWTGTLF